MKYLSDLQQSVVDKAKKQLKDKPWFKGVSVNVVPHDAEIKSNFNKAVETVVMETEYFDNPELFQRDFE